MTCPLSSKLSLRNNRLTWSVSAAGIALPVLGGHHLQHVLHGQHEDRQHTETVRRQGRLYQLNFILQNRSVCSSEDGKKLETCNQTKESKQYQVCTIAVYDASSLEL